jgi:hypothetical protein
MWNTGMPEGEKGGMLGREEGSKMGSLQGNRKVAKPAD